MVEEKISVSPGVCLYFNEDTHLLKLLEDGLVLSAHLDDINYVTAFSMCCPVAPDSAAKVHQYFASKKMYRGNYSVDKMPERQVAA